MVFLRNKHFLTLAAASIGFVAGQEEITPEAFNSGILDGSYDLVLDVRRQDEWDLGHIPTAIHVPNETFEDDDFWKSFTASEDNDYSCNKSCATIVLYCKSGRRSGEAIEKLRSMGFEGTLLNGMGVMQWTEEGGFELTTEDDSVEPVCATTDICPTAAAAEEEDAATEEETDEVSGAASLASIIGLAAAAFASIAVLI